MPDILHRVGIAADPQPILAALSSVAGIQGWWSEATTGDAAMGGSFRFRQNQFLVLQADAARVRWSYSGPAQDWVGTEISFRLEPAEGQTYVVFKQAGWREANIFMHHCSTKWAVFLLSLKEFVETGAGHPEPRDTRIAVDA